MRFLDTNVVDNVQQLRTLLLYRSFSAFLLDGFQFRKHSESDLHSKPSTAMNGHAAGMQESPNSGVSPPRRPWRAFPGTAADEVAVERGSAMVVATAAGARRAVRQGGEDVEGVLGEHPRAWMTRSTALAPRCVCTIGTGASFVPFSVSRRTRFC